MTEAQADKNPEYKHHHPDAVEDTDLAREIADTTTQWEMQIRENAKYAVEAARRGNSQEAQKSLQTMKQLKNAITSRAELITEIYNETQSILNGSGDSTEENTES